jgi:acetyl esterase/lipase
MSKQQLSELDAMLRQAPLDDRADVPTLRAGFEELMRRTPVPGDVRKTSTTVGGIEAIEVTIDGTDPANVILYLHGGVYVIGSAEASAPLVADLARRTGAKVITVDYRLAPENPYPAAVKDAKAAYEGLLSQGVDPGQIAIAGESAGAGLAAATLLELRDADTPLPSSGFLMSPWADLTLSGDTIVDKQVVDPVLTAEWLRRGPAYFVAGGDPSDPYISPVLGDLAGLPSLLIQVGSHEILLSDAIRLAGRAATANVAVTLEVVPFVPHVFQAFAATLDQADAALDRAATFCKYEVCSYSAHPCCLTTGSPCSCGTMRPGQGCRRGGSTAQIIRTYDGGVVHAAALVRSALTPYRSRDRGSPSAPVSRLPSGQLSWSLEGPGQRDG